MRRPALSWLLAALALCLADGAAQAQMAGATSEKAESVSLTVYQDPNGARGYFDGRSGLAMVTEWRTIDLPAGDSRVVFRGVADGIVPATAALDGLPAVLLERNQDYDLLSPGSLIEGSIGAPVRLIRTNRKTGAVTEQKAILRTGPNGVILEIDGHYEALGCSGEPERLVFDSIPKGLSDKPTLSMKVRARTPGRYRVRLSYLAVGLTWKANYVANVRADGRTLDLTGWITLSNDSGTSFVDAPTQVVAGDVARSWKTRATVARAKGRDDACWPIEVDSYDDAPPPPPPPPPAPMAPPPPPPPPAPEMRVAAQKKAEQSELGDYKLYTLPYPTTVAARQTKQLLMLDAEGVAFDRVQQFRVSPYGEWSADTGNLSTATLLRTDNRKTRGLGLPLPGGRVMVTETRPEVPGLIAGAYDLKNNAVGSPVDITVGSSQSVTVLPRLVEKKSRGKKTSRKYVMTVESHADAPVAFELLLEDYGYPVKISGSSIPYKAKAGGRAWTLTLAPGQRTEIRYTLTAEY